MKNTSHSYRQIFLEFRTKMIKKNQRHSQLPTCLSRQEPIGAICLIQIFGIRCCEVHQSTFILIFFLILTSLVTVYRLIILFKFMNMGIFIHSNVQVKKLQIEKNLTVKRQTASCSTQSKLIAQNSAVSCFIFILRSINFRPIFYTSFNWYIKNDLT